jgi:uncharacterized YccA/Bax inhibitor family protein
LLYTNKIVQVTEKFKSVVNAATLAIKVYYLISWLLANVRLSSGSLWQFYDEYWN